MEIDELISRLRSALQPSRRPISLALLAVATLAFVPLQASAQVPPVPTDTAQLFDDGTVQEIHLSLPADDWRRLKENYESDDYYPANFSWDGIKIANVGIRSRGSASRSGTKPGLKIDIDEYVDDQRFLGLKALILDNLTQDPSFVKERLSMRLYDRLGLPAPRETFVRLVVNNEFAGLYALVEDIDKDFIKRAYASREQQTGVPEKDGVIFEFQHVVDGYEFSYLGPELEPYQTLFEAKTHEDDSPDTLYGPLRDMCRLATESSDADFSDVLGGFIDLDQFVRYVAVENFVADVDGILGFAGMNNFYLYRLEHTTVSQVIPWDKDLAFDNVARPIFENADNNVLMRRALAVPRLRALYLETLRQAAAIASETVADDGRGWLERELDRMVEQIRPWAEADPVKPQSNEAFAGEVEKVRGIARARPGFVTCEVANVDRSDRDTQCTAQLQGQVQGQRQGSASAAARRGASRSDGRMLSSR
jgi:hypothetical protein